MSTPSHLTATRRALRRALLQATEQDRALDFFPCMLPPHQAHLRTGPWQSSALVTCGWCHERIESTLGLHKPRSQLIPLAQASIRSKSNPSVVASHVATPSLWRCGATRTVRGGVTRRPVRSPADCGSVAVVPCPPRHAGDPYARCGTITRVSGSEGGWYAVRCVFFDEPKDRRSAFYEERITLWRARSADDAIERAEAEALEYAAAIEESPSTYTGLAQCFHLFDEPSDGAEVFSLIRDSELDPDAYLDRFFDTGTEHQA